MPHQTSTIYISTTFHHLILSLISPLSPSTTAKKGNDESLLPSGIWFNSFSILGLGSKELQELAKMGQETTANFAHSRPDDSLYQTHLSQSKICAESSENRRVKWSPIIISKSQLSVIPFCLYFPPKNERPTDLLNGLHLSLTRFPS